MSVRSGGENAGANGNLGLLTEREVDSLHPVRPWHDDWLAKGNHGDHHPVLDCLRCYTALLWKAYESERRRNALLGDVAHRAWHLLDDGGEHDDDAATFIAFKRDADRLSDALDALEADGWDAHPREATDGR